MTKTKANVIERVLALDVRPSRLGYVCIEPPDRLLDCGVTRFATVRAGGLRLASILKNLRPMALVLRRITLRSRRDQPRTRAIQRLARHLARQSTMRVVSVSERQLLNYFMAREVRTKHEIASLLARTFSELAWRLPRRRKPWEPEHRHMLIFDAAALAVAYLGLGGNTDRQRMTSEAFRRPLSGAAKLWATVSFGRPTKSCLLAGNLSEPGGATNCRFR